jgi:xanthine dehydrogenase accessory factor
MSWFTPLRDWPEALISALQGEPVIVRIVLAAVRGSAPREPGVGMLVGRATFAGTIGGGQLEWEALAAARVLLDDATVPARLRRMVLAADLGQCCGGVVEVWLERYTRANLGLVNELRDAARDRAHGSGAVLLSTLKSGVVEHRIVRDIGSCALADPLLRQARAQAAPCVIGDPAGELTLVERLDHELPPLWLYGAGHVGQALARIFMELPVSLTWIDGRDGLIPLLLPDSVRSASGADPLESLAAAPAGTRFLVLTHSHALDYALCRAILARGDFAWAGLIGSKSKAARFRSRLAREGFALATIVRLVCPIGIGGISSKWPAAIAVGVAAQVLQDMSLGADGALDARRAPLTALRCNERDCTDCGP